MTIPKAIAYSPHTTLTAQLTSASTSVTVSNIAAFPDLSTGEIGTLVLCSAEDFMTHASSDFETYTYTSKVSTSNTLSGLTHREGTPRTWASGTEVASYGAAYGWNEIRSAITARLPLAGGTMTGTLAMNDNLVSQPDIKDYVETLASATWDSATEDIDLENGNVHKISITAAVTTLTFSNPRAGAHSFTLILEQDGTGRAITWPASVDWPGGTAPTIDGADEVHILEFFTPDSGTTWYGFHAGSDMS